MKKRPKNFEVRLRETGREQTRNGHIKWIRAFSPEDILNSPHVIEVETITELPAKHWDYVKFYYDLDLTFNN